MVTISQEAQEFLCGIEYPKARFFVSKRTGSLAASITPVFRSGTRRTMTRC